MILNINIKDEKKNFKQVWATLSRFKKKKHEFEKAEAKGYKIKSILLTIKEKRISLAFVSVQIEEAK